MNTIKINSKKTKMVAHRGLSGIECENTAAAFVAAANRSYFGIETDVHRTRDGKFIIIHDHETTRVSGGAEHIIEETDFDVLRSVRLLDKSGRVRADLCLPTLDEYLRILKTYEKTAVLEIKGGMKKGDIAEILSVVDREYCFERVVFISFDFENLVFVRELCPSAHIQYLCAGEVTEELIRRLLKYGFGLDHHYRDLKREDVERLHECCIEVNCWTVDDPEDASRLISWGVDYITSNILE